VKGGKSAEENTNQLQINPPSREAMEGKLRIYADEGMPRLERCLACEAESGRHRCAQPRAATGQGNSKQGLQFIRTHFYPRSMSRHGQNEGWPPLGLASEVALHGVASSRVHSRSLLAVRFFATNSVQFLSTVSAGKERRSPEIVPVGR
jgi:hypothetical protein